MRFYGRKNYRQNVKSGNINALIWAFYIGAFFVVYFQMVENTIGEMQLF